MAKHGLSIASGIGEYRYTAANLGVVDGDTFDSMVDLGFGVFRRERFRVYGINAPERGKGGWDAAKADLCRLLLNGGPKRIATFKDRRDKYGRYVADVVIVNHHGFAAWLSDEMLRLGNVVEYMQ
jgi:endonuclease YncB( thermonuclease family)